MLIPFKLENEKFIFIDLKTKEKSFPDLEFDFIIPLKNEIAIVQKEKKYGVINNKGQLIVPLIYDFISENSESHFLICSNQKFGIIDISGRLVIPPIYQNLSTVHNGLIKYSDEEDLYSEIYVDDTIFYGYLNLSHKIAIKPQYLGAKDFSNGYAVVGKLVGYDGQHNNIIKYGYIDINGNEVIDFQFDSANSFIDDVALVTLNEKHYYINKKGEEVINIEQKKLEQISSDYPEIFVKEHIIWTSYGEKRIIETYGFKDKSGKIVISPIYNSAERFENGLAKVSVKNNTFYILPNGEELCIRNIDYDDPIESLYL